MEMFSSPNFGAFVISLDFELYWGVRDFLASNTAYKKNILGEHQAIPAILSVFKEFSIAATWATVGFLFADSKAELNEFKPAILPAYKNQNLSPYLENFEETLSKDSVQYAPNLINLIRQTPRQEIGTHTFSHYYCLEEGQNAETFAADIESAVAIAEKHSINLKSIVFPRNQHNPEYDEILLKNGIICYRGNQQSRIYQFGGNTQNNPFYRTARLVDSYFNVSGLNTFCWSNMRQGKIANFPASMFLRPVSKKKSFLNNLQFRRICDSLEYAAKNNQIFHLWWHPHNFGVNLEENLNFLRRIFYFFHEMQKRHEMQSLSMYQAAECALEKL